MFAKSLLAVVASLATRAYAAELIVGIISCQPYALGTVDYSTQATAPLGGYRTTLSSQQEFTVSVNSAACAPNIAPAYEFQICNSTFMAYDQTPTIKYGILKEVASGKCLYTNWQDDSTTMSLQDCYISDDSGQVFQWFAYGSPTDPSVLTFLRERNNGTNPLGLGLVPAAPPSPLADFPVTFVPGSSASENQLYLESFSSCI